MKKFTLVLMLAFLLCTTKSFADYVNGYTRSNGTHVDGYHRSSPDGNPYNNYSTKGNVNPYTGKVGTVDPDSSSSGFSRNIFGEKSSFDKVGF